MKKEAFAAILLVLILALSLLNSKKLDSLTNQLTQIVENCNSAASNENWPQAQKGIEEAISTWKKNDSYTHIVLRHSEIDSMADDLYELKEHIYAHDAGAVYGISGLVAAHLQSISSMEKIRLGSIF